MLPPHEVQVAAFLAHHAGTAYTCRDIADQLPGTPLRFVRDVIEQLAGMALVLPGGSETDPAWSWAPRAEKRSPSYLKQLRDSADRHGVTWPTP